jgi:hypothetical protein
MKMIFSNVKKPIPTTLIALPQAQPQPQPLVTPFNKSLIINISTNCSTCGK